MKQAITYKDLELSLGEIISIEELEIRQRPNHHGELYLSAVLDSEVGEMAYYDMPQKLILSYRQEGVRRILFKGIIRESSMRQLGKHMRVSLKAYDTTCLLDSKRRIRSFQNISRTSHSVLEEVMENYPGCICTRNIPKEKIGQIWFQYEETDWEFLCRFVSHYGGQLYADATYSHARFQAGLSAERIEVEWENFPYKTKMDIKLYDYLSQNGFEHLEPYHFLTYMVNSYQLHTLGSQLIYKDREWFIGSLTRKLEEGILVCSYELKQESAMLVPKSYNQKITGISVDGKIKQVNRDKVRVNLNADIHEEQRTYWFPFSTVASSSDGSGWYSMPQQGDSIRVYFPTRDEKEGYAITKHDRYTPVKAVNDVALQDNSEIETSEAESTSVLDTCSRGEAGGYFAGDVSGENLLGESSALSKIKTIEPAKFKQEKENPMDDPEKKNIFTQDGNTIQLIPDGVVLCAGEAKVFLNKDGKIVFNAPGGITVDAKEEIKVQGRNITLAAKNWIECKNDFEASMLMSKLLINMQAKEIYMN